MKFDKPFRAAFPLLLIASLICSPDTHAGDFYVGADLNRSYVDESIDIDGAGVRLDGDATGTRLTFGYAFNDYFAAELAHTDFGDLEQSALGLALSAEGAGEELAVLGRLPLGGRFTLFGRLGYISWDGEVGVDAVSESISGDDLSVGAGLEFAFGENLSASLSGTKYRLDDLDLAVLGPGIRFRF